MATKQRHRVQRTRKSKSKPQTKCVLQRPRGVIAPRVAKVGVEKFAIVCVDPAKKRSWWMMADFLGQVLIDTVAVEHDRQAKAEGEDGDEEVSDDKAQKLHRAEGQGEAQAGHLGRRSDVAGKGRPVGGETEDPDQRKQRVGH